MRRRAPTSPRFIGANSEDIVWTPGATQALNLVANGFAAASAGLGGEAAAPFRLAAGDEIVVTELEHHANLIPWQQLALRTGATLRWIGLNDDGTLRYEELETVITDRTRVVAFTHASNVTGVVTDVAAFVNRAREVGAITVLDACQSVPAPPGEYR